ncbi:MAG: DUF4837 domain-containing protein, partial [Flavobacteriaceae bacterium CG_4_10_14_3_um_filter_33_47]
MKKAFLITVLSLIILSCGNEKSENKKILSDSSGNINNVSIVVDNDLWSGSIGDAIRTTLAVTVDGLPQDEPMYSMNQIPTSVFTGFVTKNRTILKVESSQKTSTTILEDVYAKPQCVVVVSGPTKDAITNEIIANANKIREAFKTLELKEKQRRINLSLFNDKGIEDKLGVSIKFPSAYRIAKQDDKFFWIRKDIEKG